WSSTCTPASTAMARPSTGSHQKRASGRTTAAAMEGRCSGMGGLHHPTPRGRSRKPPSGQQLLAGSSLDTAAVRSAPVAGRRRSVGEAFAIGDRVFVPRLVKGATVVESYDL